MRMILRMSINYEKDGALSGKLNKLLTDAGFEKHPKTTATYEHGEISAHELAVVMGEFWGRASAHADPGEIDSVWMYADDPHPVVDLTGRETTHAT